MQSSRPRNVLHAPNVRQGGGFVLLRELLRAGDRLFDRVQLDERIKGRIGLPSATSVRYVRPSLWSRLAAEWRLWNESCDEGMILCFHGLPPLFPARGHVVVFIQNRLLVETGSLAAYPIRVRCRIWTERLWGYALQGRCSRYIVQTPSMAASVRKWLRRDRPVSVVAFSPPLAAANIGSDDHPATRFDFVYVASGEPHKNHRNLLDAWCLLAEGGFRPSLALTVDANAYPELTAAIKTAIDRFGVTVVNLGSVAPTDVAEVYRTARAMVYASTKESLGLPLIEATRFGLPILAPELDYVRDVALPVETFDPESPTSIARAVRRFLGTPEPTMKVGTVEDFLAEVSR